MKLLSLHIENFGKLSNFDYVFQDGINIINQANGWGKTTFACFLKAMFYGMEKRGRLKAYLADRSRFAPWQGGVYGGSVIFEHNQKVYKVLRTFSQTPEGDRFELVDVKSGSISRDFSIRLGEEIFGVGSDTFSLTTFFGQGELEGEINDEVRAFLTGANGLNADMQASEGAIGKLDKSIKNLKNQIPSMIEINQVQNKKEALNEKLRELEENKKIIAEGISVREEKLNSLKHNVNYHSHNETIKTDDKTTKQSQSAKPKGNKILSAIFFALFIAFAVACGLSYLNIILCSVFGAISLILMILSLIFIFKTRKHFDKKDELENEISSLKQKLHFEQADAEFVKQRADLEKEIAVLEERLAYINEQILRYINEVEEVENNLNFAIKQKKELEEKISLLLLVKDFILKAKQNISVRFVEPMQKKLVEMLSVLSNKNMHTQIDFDFNIKLDTPIGLMEKQFLSQGSKDLVEICKRFALVESVFTDVKPFIVLDDPFVNLDDATLKNAIDLTTELSKKYQIIYLTCHSSRVLKA